MQSIVVDNGAELVTIGVASDAGVSLIDLLSIGITDSVIVVNGVTG